MTIGVKVLAPCSPESDCPSRVHRTRVAFSLQRQPRVQQVMESAEAADAMKLDGVRPETIQILVES
jgi:hypothetical protein